MDASNTFARRLMWVLWPSFLVAAAANALFFTALDPHDLAFFGQPIELSRELMYTIGFFAFWAIAIASSGLTVFLERSPWEVNRCPLPVDARPDGCPKQGDGCTG
ncbi:MAG TPA: hypothetical protein VFX05_11985 [Casimicrobiaceae bacterium]|nr:hypothetical protein [Casimicrobiaceae bacterium]